MLTIRGRRMCIRTLSKPFQRRRGRNDAEHTSSQAAIGIRVNVRFMLADRYRGRSSNASLPAYYGLRDVKY